MSDIGLLNEGNTCYMNSALQCLMHIPEIQEYFLSGTYEQQHKYFPSNRSNILKEFADQFKTLLISLNDKNDKRPVRPVSFRKILGVFKPSFNTSEQQDAHECLTIILETLSESLKMHVSINISGSINSHSDDRKINAFQQYKQFLLKQGYSMINSTFFGQFDSTITCKSCNKSFYNYDPYSSLEIEIPPNANSLNDCLENYCYQETLAGDNLYHCQICKKSTSATKILRIWTIPNILIIQLKRFGGINHKFIKNNKYITYPMKLNMTKYVTHPNAVDSNGTIVGLQMFDLIGVIEHSGSLQGGHYVAKTCNNGLNNGSNNDQWLLFNDASVTNIDKNQIITPNSYVLIYRMDQETRKKWNK